MRRLHPNALLTSPLFRLEDLFIECLDNYEELDSEDVYVSGKIILRDWYEGQ